MPEQIRCKSAADERGYAAKRSGKDKKMNENASVTYIKGIFTAVFSVLTSLFGVLAVPILLMVGTNVIDYVTGLIAAPTGTQL